ncbi:MAG: murein hydrolase activator EnvC family protein, partial [Endomicrobiia bacterium]
MENFQRRIIKFFLFFLILLTSNIISANEYNKIIKEYKKEIKSKESDLEQIEKKIEEKKAEKLKYEKEEKELRKELNKIDQELNKIISEIVKIQSEIRRVEKKLKQTEQEMKIVSLEINSWKSALARELRYLYKNVYGTYYLFIDPWAENLIIYTLKQKAKKIISATERKLYTEKVFTEYIETKNELEKLKKTLSEKQSEYKKVYDEKSKLLATAKGKKISAEEEIKKLNETTQELKRLIESLEKKKQETLEMMKQEQLAKKEFKEKMHFLPWPVDGEIVSNFGKNKHP